MHALVDVQQGGDSTAFGTHLDYAMDAQPLEMEAVQVRID